MVNSISLMKEKGSHWLPFFIYNKTQNYLFFKNYINSFKTNRNGILKITSIIYKRENSLNVDMPKFL